MTSPYRHSPASIGGPVSACSTSRRAATPKQKRPLGEPTEIGPNFGSHMATLLRHLFWVFLRLALRDVDEAKRHVDRMLGCDESGTRFGHGAHAPMRRRCWLPMPAPASGQRG